MIGFDIERHDHGTGGYPGQLVIQDVLTLNGSQFRDADYIVASPPCQAYSYRAMPWKRAKALPPPDNSLFDACFRIQREACEAAGRYIPMVVENVCGAQKWVGKAKWHYGSYYLWGDVPALMPVTFARKTPSVNATKNTGGSWFAVAHNRKSGHSRNPVSDSRFKSNPGTHDRVDGPGRPRFIRDGAKFGGGWRHDPTNTIVQKSWSHSPARKAASAMIAKIPFPLAAHIAEVFHPARRNYD